MPVFSFRDGTVVMNCNALLFKDSGLLFLCRRTHKWAVLKDEKCRNTLSKARLLRRPVFKHFMLAFSVNRFIQREAGKRLFTRVCDTVEEVENKRAFMKFWKYPRTL